MKTMYNESGDAVGLVIDEQEPVDAVLSKARSIQGLSWLTKFEKADALRHGFHCWDQPELEALIETFGFDTQAGAQNHSRLAWFDAQRRRVDIPTRVYFACCGLGSNTSEKIEWARRLFDLGLKQEKKNGAFPPVEFFSNVKKTVRAMAREQGHPPNSDDADNAEIADEVFVTRIPMLLDQNPDQLHENMTGIIATMVFRFMELLEGKHGMVHFELKATAFMPGDENDR